MILKGKVSGILNGGAAVTVTPYGGGVVTVPLTVPRSLSGILPINTPVLYVTFEDNTGLVLSRMDGESVGGTGGNLEVSTDGDAIVINTSNSTVLGGV